MKSPIKRFIFDKLVAGFFHYRHVILLATLAVGATTGYSIYFISQADCKEFSNALQIGLPSSVENFKEQCLPSPRNQPIYRAEFTLSPKDLESLKQHLKAIQIRYWYPTVPNISKSDADWVEKGEKMKSLSYAEYIGSDHLTKILIDTSDPEKYVVHYEEALTNLN